MDYAAELTHGIAYQRAGATARATVALSRAAAEDAPRAVAAQAHIRLAALYRNASDPEQALHHARLAREAASHVLDPTLDLEARNAEGAVYLQQRDFARAEAVFSELLASSFAAADDEPLMKARGLALSNLGTIRAEGGTLLEARTCFAAAHTCFLLAGYVFGVPLALHNLGAVCLDLGELDEALGYLIEARGEAIRAGDLELASLASMNIGEAVARGGDPERAGDLIEQALGGFSAAGNRSRRCYALGVYALIAELRGAPDLARSALESGIEEARELGLAYLETRFMNHLARLAPDH